MTINQEKKADEVVLRIPPPSHNQNGQSVVGAAVKFFITLVVVAAACIFATMILVPLFFRISSFGRSRLQTPIVALMSIASIIVYLRALRSELTLTRNGQSGLIDFTLKEYLGKKERTLLDGSISSTSQCHANIARGRWYSRCLHAIRGREPWLCAILLMPSPINGISVMWFFSPLAAHRCQQKIRDFLSSPHKNQLKIVRHSGRILTGALWLLALLMALR